MKIDENLEFLLRIIPNTNFINIVKNSGGFLGSPSKKLNEQYRIYLINKKLKQNIPVKVFKTIILEIKALGNESLNFSYVEPKRKFIKLLCESYLNKNIKEFNRYKHDLLNTNETKKVKNEDASIKSNKEIDNLEKIIENQKIKIKLLNETQQTEKSKTKKIKKQNNELENICQSQKEKIDNLNSKVEKLLLSIEKLREKLYSENNTQNNSDQIEKENRQLRLKLQNFIKNIKELKDENSILNEEKNKLQEKIVVLNLKKFLLIGMPIGCKYGSIKVPENVSLQIAINSSYRNLNDNKILEYSTISDLLHTTKYSIDAYKKVIIFNGEVTRRDIIEITEKVEKGRICYVSNLNELENILKSK